MPGNELSKPCPIASDSGTSRKEAETFLDLGLCHLGLMVLKSLTVQDQVIPGLRPHITDSVGTAIPREGGG